MSHKLGVVKPTTLHIVLCIAILSMVATISVFASVVGSYTITKNMIQHPFDPVPIERMDPIPTQPVVEKEG